MNTESKNNFPLVFIIIINWKNEKITIECLESLYKINYPNFHVIVVDNNSIDATAKAIKKKFPLITLLQNYDNLGFAEGNNLGINKALEMNADYIFILNNDTIIDSIILWPLVKQANNNPEIGVLGCKIYYYDEPKKIWFAGEMRDTCTGFRKYFGKNRIDDGYYDDLIECNNLTGCAMFIPAKVIRETGGFDKDFFAYSEDIDLCLRIRELGYRIYCERKAKIWHKVSSSLGNNSPIKVYFSVRNRLLVISKHCNKPFRLYFLIFQHVYLITVAILKYAIKGKLKIALAMINGIHDYHRKKFGKGRYQQIL
ncbi:MAG: glycosyltransferase family 2 protein [Thermoplasmatales archaeon]|nr:glycosyltransferase family 2 protein [Thermoplasmatales archaeon]